MSGALDVIDVEWEDKVQRSREAVVDNVIVVNESTETFIPEEYVAPLAECLGDGLARISVSGDLAVNDYGTKAGSHVTVSVTCGNNEEDIEKAHSIARTIMEKCVAEDVNRMEAMLNQRISKKTSTPTTAPASRPSPTTTAAAPTKAAARPSMKPTTIPKRVGKPTFQRG